MEFKDFESLQRYFSLLGKELSALQEDLTPALFSHLADAFLEEYKREKTRFKLSQQSLGQEKKEAKFIKKLKKKGWRKRILGWFFEPPQEKELPKEPLKEEPIKDNIKTIVVEKQVYIEVLKPDEGNAKEGEE